jgi:very-short-patch-repair endonuclease
VELDGGVHQTQREYDADRDRILAELGVRVLRFPNEEVITDLSMVLNKILKACG